MGLCCSTTGGPRQPRAERQKQALINAQLLSAHRKEDKVIKILFLGGGESGKTTAVKQMRMLYGKDDDDEADTVQESREIIMLNVINGAKSVLHANANLKLGMKPLGQAAVHAAEVVRGVGFNAMLTPEVAEAINVLWKDKGFRHTWSQRSRYQVLDNFDYFAEKVRSYPTWGGPEWVPSVQDTLRARRRTTGIVQHEMVINKTDFLIVDVGGQKSERGKWVHCFDNVSAVVCMVAISEYDQKLFEDNSSNRLIDALELFESIANSKWFKDASVILFLNKIDLLKRKLCKNKVPLNASGFFPDAPSGFDYDTACQWFKRKFEALAQTKKVYTHMTCALDTDFMDTVFQSAVHGIMDRVLRASGLGGLD
jgi:guanine nucleotide-binding protein G(i) subunit alpha